MSHRLEAGLAIVFVGVVLITICWIMRKRDDSLYVETELTDASHVRLVESDDDNGGWAA
jgi:hypothetical protein